MTPESAAEQFYESARRELMEHIKLRDAVLLFYLGAMATLISVAFGTGAKPIILLVAPFITLGTSMIVTQHHVSIGALSAYCVLEIGKYLDDSSHKGHPAQWDNSRAMFIYSRKEILFRTFGHIILLISPSIFALFYLYCNELTSLKGGSEIIIWWFGVAALLCSFYYVYSSHNTRNAIFNDISSMRNFEK